MSAGLVPGKPCSYALEIADEDHCLIPCRCGYRLYRGRVMGDDWKRPELQERYWGRFAFFIQCRMDQQQ